MALLKPLVVVANQIVPISSPDTLDPTYAPGSGGGGGGGSASLAGYASPSTSVAPQGTLTVTHPNDVSPGRRRVVTVYQNLKPTGDDFLATSFVSNLASVNATASGAAYDLNTTTAGNLRWSVPAGSSIEYGIVEAFPYGTADFTAVLKGKASAFPGNYCGFGIILSDVNTNTTGNQMAARIGYNGGTIWQRISYGGSTFGSGSQQPFGSATTFTAGTYYYIRLRRLSGTYYMAWSSDGVTWNNEQSFTLSFTANYIGITVENVSGSAINYDFDYFRFSGEGSGALPAADATAAYDAQVTSGYSVSMLDGSTTVKNLTTVTATMTLVVQIPQSALSLTTSQTVYAGPGVGNFAWVNQSTAAATQTADGITLTAPSVGGDNFRLLVASAPTSPYTITAKYEFLAPLPPHYAQIGLLLRNSGSGNFLIFSTQCVNGTPDVNTNVNRFNSPTSNNSTPFASGNMPLSVAPAWFRITDDGTNRNFYTSQDGNNWVQVFRESRTAFITPDQYGFFIQSNNNPGNGIGPTALLSQLYVTGQALPVNYQQGTVVVTSAGADLTTGLLRSYPLNETSGTTAADAASGINLTLGGSGTTLTGNGYTFNGSGYLSGVDTGLPSGAADCSILMRVKFTSSPGSNAQFVTFGSGGGGQFILYNNSASTIAFSHSGDSSTGSWNINDGVSHSVAVTQKGNRVRVYVDGDQIALAPDFLTKNVTLNGTLTIGCNNDAGKTAKVAATIADVRIYGRALTHAQVIAYDA